MNFYVITFTAIFFILLNASGEESICTYISEMIKRQQARNENEIWIQSICSTLECPRGDPTETQIRFFANISFCQCLQVFLDILNCNVLCKNIGDRWRHNAVGTISVVPLRHILNKIINILIAQLNFSASRWYNNTITAALFKFSGSRSGIPNTLLQMLPSVTGKVNSRWRPSNQNYIGRFWTRVHHNFYDYLCIRGQTFQWCYFRYWIGKSKMAARNPKWMCNYAYISLYADYQ